MHHILLLIAGRNLLPYNNAIKRVHTFGFKQFVRISVAIIYTFIKNHDPHAWKHHPLRYRNYSIAHFGFPSIGQ